MPQQKFKLCWNSMRRESAASSIPRANEPGRVVLMFESASVETVQEVLNTLPFAQLHLIDFDVIPLAPFTGLARLFQAPTGKTL